MSNDAQTAAPTDQPYAATSADRAHEVPDELARLREELARAREERDGLIAQIAAMGRHPHGQATEIDELADDPVTLDRLPCDGSHPDM